MGHERLKVFEVKKGSVATRCAGWDKEQQGRKQDNQVILKQLKLWSWRGCSHGRGCNKLLRIARPWKTLNIWFLHIQNLILNSEPAWYGG